MIPQIIRWSEGQACSLLQLRSPQVLPDVAYARMIASGERITYELRERNIVPPRRLTTAMLCQNRRLA